MTLKKSVCPSFCIIEMQGSNKDCGTRTTVVEVGIVCGVTTEAGGGMVGVIRCLMAPSTKSWFGVLFRSVDRVP